MNLNLSKFKKLKEDERSATLRHPAGHEIRVSKQHLNKNNLKELSSLPMHLAEGTPDEPIQDPRAPQQPQHPTIVINNTPPPQQPQQQAPDYFTNGTFDTSKFIQQNPNSPISSKMGVIHQMDQQAQVEEQAKQMKATKDMEAYQQAMQYNQIASQRGLPPVPTPNMPELMKSELKPDETPSNVPSTNIHGTDTPIIGKGPQAPQDEFGLDEYGKNIRSGISGVQHAINQEAKALGEQGKAEADIYHQTAASFQDIQKRAEEITNHFQEEQNKMMDDYKAGHFTPYLQRMSTGQKIMTGIGLVLGGMGGGLMHQENPALKFLNQQIDNDLQIQQKEMDKKHNLLSANMENFKDMQTALAMTKANLLGFTAARIQEEGAKAQDPLVKARAAQASNKFLLEQSNLIRMIGWQKAATQGMSGAQEGSSTDSIAKSINAMRIVNPEYAKSMESRFIPGVGLAQVPVTPDVRDKLSSGEELQNKVADIIQFAKKHGGSIDPAVIAQGKVKASQLQNAFRVASKSGVFKESDQKFIESFAPSDPTAFVGQWRTLPKYKEMMNQAEMEMDTLKKHYGLPASYRLPENKAPEYTGKK